jgi:hypothetical protein
MKKRSSAQSAPARRSLGEGGFFSSRALLALVISVAACSVVTVPLMAFLHSETPAKSTLRTFTFEERVSYQRAIEDVYWHHRIWPRDRGECPDPKPSLDAVMSQAQLEKKVKDYLRNSQALEDYWQRPITAEQLQAEMDRMAKHTRQPEVLQELFEALGNDSFVVAECLARPALAERLLAQPAFEHVKETSRSFDRTIAATAGYTLPTISDPTGGCTDNTWTPTTITNAPDPREGHTAVWTGTEMIVWGGFASGNLLNTGRRYNLSTDTWLATSINSAPSGREFHTAVWSGSEMTVWGGEVATGNGNTGGRYNPVTDSWIATSTANAPESRERHTAVWAGTEMIIWGGTFNFTYFNTGGRYNPATDTWTATSTVNAPDPRSLPTAVWNTDEMIVWGGSTGSPNFLNTGGRYDPSTDSWTATSTTNAPSARDLHTTVWTGSEMIVWGGADANGLFNTGGRYDPSTDSWAATSTTNAPSARDSHTAVWTGDQMIIWGGYTPGVTNTGGRYSPGTDSWTATSTPAAPEARYNHTAVWNASEMIVWGGTNGPNSLNTGGRYCATRMVTPRPRPTPHPRPTPP